MVSERDALRVLIFEDSEADAELLAAELVHAGISSVFQRVDTEETFTHALREFEPDVIICDHALKQFNGIAALKVIQAIRPTAPLPRQIEVLRFVAEGHTNREVARRLQLSVKTVESHRGEVMKRLGVHDVAGVVRYAVRVGLVTPSVEDI